MAPTPFTILVVHERPAVRQFVDLAVGSDAVSVVGAVDAHAALACVERARPDLVLAATGLAGLGAQDLAGRLSSLGVPVVLVKGSLEHIKAEPDVAAAGVLSKPLQVRQLRELVAQTLLERSRVTPPQGLAENAVDDDDFDADPIDAWLSGADMSLGAVSRQWQRMVVDAGDLHSFLKDVSALRSGATSVRRLQFTPGSYSER